MRKALAIVALLIAGVVAAYSWFGESVRYRITVEDMAGNKLGFGVWQYRIWHGFVAAYNFSLKGQAFPIELPSGGGRAFVVMGRGLNSSSMPGGFNTRGALRMAFQKAGLKPSRKYRSKGSDEVEVTAVLASVKGRAELQPEDRPSVVRFADPNDPTSIQQVLMKGQDKNHPAGLELRFYVEVTADPISAGIEKMLPWIIEYQKRSISYLSGGKKARTVKPDSPLSTKSRIYDFIRD